MTHIGEWIYRNECNRNRQCLVDWNPGESFPSLGIGHFIWYPRNINENYIESFPLLIEYLQSKAIPLPTWLQQLQPFDAPWPDRETFINNVHSSDVESLRKFLEHHTAEQTAFMLQRLQQAIPNLIEHAQQSEQASLKRKLNRLCDTPQGWYALIDYVNFKGEGLSTKETYQGQGWGLFQVLQEMTITGRPNDAFAQAAERILSRRAELATNPIEKQRWLPGWRKRVHTYGSEPMLD